MKNLNCIKAMLTAVISGAALLAMPTTMASADAETDVTEKESVDFTTRFGDVNFDSDVNVSDAVQMRRFLLGSSAELGNWKNADLDADEDVDVFDYILLGKQLTGKTPANGGTLRLKVVDMMSNALLSEKRVFKNRLVFSSVNQLSLINHLFNLIPNKRKSVFRLIFH